MSSPHVQNPNCTELGTNWLLQNNKADDDIFILWGVRSSVCLLFKLPVELLHFDILLILPVTCPKWNSSLAWEATFPILLESTARPFHYLDCLG